MCSAHSGVYAQLKLPGFLCWGHKTSPGITAELSTLAAEALKNLRTPSGTTHLNAPDSKQQPRGGECRNEPECSGHFHYRSILTSLEKLQQLAKFKAEPTDMCSMAGEGWLLFLYVLSWEKAAFHKQVQLEKSLYIHSLLSQRMQHPESSP